MNQGYLISCFILKPTSSLSFDTHFYGHEVENNTNDTYAQIGYYINQIPDSTPSVVRVLGNGKLYVTVRYDL